MWILCHNTTQLVCVVCFFVAQVFRYFGSSSIRSGNIEILEYFLCHRIVVSQRRIKTNHVKSKNTIVWNVPFRNVQMLRYQYQVGCRQCFSLHSQIKCIFGLCVCVFIPASNGSISIFSELYHDLPNWTGIWGVLNERKMQ